MIFLKEYGYCVGWLASGLFPDPRQGREGCNLLICWEPPSKPRPSGHLSKCNTKLQQTMLCIPPPPWTAMQAHYVSYSPLRPHHSSTLSNFFFLSYNINCWCCESERERTQKGPNQIQILLEKHSIPFSLYRRIPIGQFGRPIYSRPTDPLMAYRFDFFSVRGFGTLLSFILLLSRRTTELRDVK